MPTNFTEYPPCPLLMGYDEDWEAKQEKTRERLAQLPPPPPLEPLQKNKRRKHVE